MVALAISLLIPYRSSSSFVEMGPCRILDATPPIMYPKDPFSIPVDPLLSLPYVASKSFDNDYGSSVLDTKDISNIAPNASKWAS